MNISVMQKRLTAFLVTLFATSEAMTFEEPKVFNTSEIIPAYLVAGPHHRVRELAQGDGYMIGFVIDSDYGTYECVGTGELQRRVQEIRAISTLVEVSRSDLFAEGLRKSVEAPIDAVKNIVTDPGGAVKQIPKSVGHFFGKVGSGIGNAARKAGEKRQDDQKTQPKDVGKGIGKVIKSAAGFDKAKLETARQLGIDPYTDNARLQEEIEKVTWAFFAGGLPMKIGMSVAPSGASQALSATEFVGQPDDLYRLTASELDFQDRQTLKAMGITPERIDALFANPNLTLSLRHRMVGMVAGFTGSGRGDLVGLMESCDSVWRAHFLADIFDLLKTRQETQPYISYGVYGRLAVALTTDGILDVPAPVDYVSWTEPVAEFATREDIAAVKRRLILQGNLSPESKIQLAAAGWEVIRLPR